jgi:hypothetical protein
MNKIFGAAAITILITATAITILNKWPAPLINQWQIKITNDDKYFPALTIFIMALPPLLVLFLIKKAALRFGKK